MNRWMYAARKVIALLFVILGAVIVGRGLAEAAPLSFSVMGLLMIALGVYRLRLMRWVEKGRG